MAALTSLGTVFLCFTGGRRIATRTERRAKNWGIISGLVNMVLRRIVQACTSAWRRRRARCRMRRRVVRRALRPRPAAAGARCCSAQHRWAPRRCSPVRARPRRFSSVVTVAVTASGMTTCNESYRPYASAAAEAACSSPPYSMMMGCTTRRTTRRASLSPVEVRGHVNNGNCLDGAPQHALRLAHELRYDGSADCLCTREQRAAVAGGNEHDMIVYVSMWKAFKQWA
eukprot:TRINITY_DN2781_c0_g2_i1.p2 TRINITY_DN2781_c0_g2~~TRINITY_DN2781_c0_g2_i1.p2  ORF type:complete len:228 (+),score=16.95 TRINITY_DN2781_c0_g2_i1:204-887(+)